MSKYTMQLRYLCELKAGLTESSSDPVAVINAAYPKIIFPETDLFDTDYASVLYPKILKHYYFDEIAHETAAHFIFRLNTKLDEILPYYNQLYNSALLEFNPFYDVDVHTVGNREDNNTDDRTRTDNLAQHAETENWNLNSDTPQSSIAEISLTGNIYLSDASKGTGQADTTNTGTQKNAAVIHNLNKYAEHVYGKRGGASYAALLKEFRETFLNTDMMLIEELRSLFMQVY